MTTPKHYYSKEIRKEYNRKYYENNKIQAKAYYRNRTPEQKLKIKQGIREKELRRRYWISKYKVKRGCFLCGYNLHSSALDFDHIDPKQKSFQISTKLHSKLKTFINEIRKCQILCANCHRIKTFDKEHFEYLLSFQE